MCVLEKDAKIVKNSKMAPKLSSRSRNYLYATVARRGVPRAKKNSRKIRAARRITNVFLKILSRRSHRQVYF